MIHDTKIQKCCTPLRRTASSQYGTWAGTQNASSALLRGDPLHDGSSSFITLWLRDVESRTLNWTETWRVDYSAAWIGTKSMSNTTHSHWCQWNARGDRFHRWGDSFCLSNALSKWGTTESDDERIDHCTVRATDKVRRQIKNLVPRFDEWLERLSQLT
jgi:hypothetical protein